MAPKAAQRAAFKKHRGPDSRTVMDTEILDVKNSAGSFYSSGRRLLPLILGHFVSSLLAAASRHDLARHIHSHGG
jgi:hypothetical protein